MSRFIQTLAVHALEVVRRVVAVQTKHAQRLFEMQLNELEYGQVPLLPFDKESRSLSLCSDEKNGFLHEYKRKEGREVFLQGTAQSI